MITSSMEMAPVNLFQIGQVHYLLLVDCFSGFPLLICLHSFTSHSVIDKLYAWLELFGYLRIIRTDGGPQFCTEFEKFCDDLSINHKLASPYNPRSNGSAEEGVKNIKRLWICYKPSKFEETSTSGGALNIS